MAERTPMTRRPEAPTPITDVVREKYGEAARRVLAVADESADAGGCCTPVSSC